MTYLANILSHPQKNELIEIFGNNHFDELYKKVKQEKIPFYKWHMWVQQEVSDALIKTKINRRSEKFGFLKKLKQKTFKSKSKVET